jgi:hypothetical protein
MSKEAITLGVHQQQQANVSRRINFLQRCVLPPLYLGIALLVLSRLVSDSSYEILFILSYLVVFGISFTFQGLSLFVNLMRPRYAFPKGALQSSQISTCTVHSSKTPKESFSIKASPEGLQVHAELLVGDVTYYPPIKENNQYICVPWSAVELFRVYSSRSSRNPMARRFSIELKDEQCIYIYREWNGTFLFLGRERELLECINQYVDCEIDDELL